MPEDEFELYLTLLAKTLCLDEEQRRAIAAELRDHLEQRLDELMSMGHTRNDAICLALAEFEPPETMARVLQWPALHKPPRRLVMQIALATVAVTTLASALVMVTSSTVPPPYQAEAPGDPPAAQVQLVNHSQASADQFELDQKIRFYARSEAEFTAREGKEALPVLTAYGLEFSHDIPQGVFRNRVWGDDPYFVQAPDDVSVRELRDRETNEPVGLADTGQPLYGELSTFTTFIPDGQATVTVKLYGPDDQLLGQADALIHMRSDLFSMAIRTGDHSVQKHLMDFGRRDDWQDIARLEVSVRDEAVEVGAADAVPSMDVKFDGADAEKVFELPNDFSREVEMRVLYNAVQELNRSIDEHRRLFEAALVNPELATDRQRIRADWKLQSLQALRAELSEKLLGYMLGC